MKNMTALALAALLASAAAQANDDPAAVLQRLKLPPGFGISLFATGLPNARSLALGDDGVVYVGTGDAGKLYAVQDTDGDGVADNTHVLAQGLYMPNGVAYKDGDLYVATVDRILRYADIGRHLAAPPRPAVVYGQFPTDRHHGWKYLRFGPDGKLYTAVGAPCNVCEPRQPIFATLVRLDTDGQHLEILASGIRNTVGFDWQPATGALFFNDNGRDHLGDDAPPDELNRWSGPGGHFGYPYCHGANIPDPELGAGKRCDAFIPPVWEYKAHIAPLGMRFYQGRQFPGQYHQQLLVAQHGSWNRSVPQGYQVVVVKMGADHLPIAEESFISGWLTADGRVLGRPVDILELPDGGVLVSDDHLGVIYKVSYQQP